MRLSSKTWRRLVVIERGARGAKPNRTNWNYVIVILTCLAPFGVDIKQGEGWHYFYVLALFWFYSYYTDTHTSTAGITYVDPLTVFLACILSSLRFLFAYNIIRHLRGETSRRAVWISAVLSQLPVILYLLIAYLTQSWVSFFVGGPVPLLVIAGLVIAYFKGKEPPSKPWSEE
jgi:hypothetical protein